VAGTVSEKIYQAFFANLAQRADVRPETVRGLRTLYSAGCFTDKRQLNRLTQEMESRYAQDQDADR
jgi:hypothetical protein